MAQVTRKEIVVPGIGVPKIPVPGPSPLTAIGDALGVAAKFIQAKNDEILRTKEVDFQTTSLSSFRTFSDKLQGELKPNFGDDLDGYSLAYNQQLQREVKRISDNAPSSGSRNVVLSQLSQVMDSMSGRARKDEENAVIGAAKVHLDQNANQLINEILREPDRVQENLAMIENMIDEAPWAQDRKLVREWKAAKKQEAWVAYARHFRENDPKELLADVKDGFYDDKLDSNIIAALKDQADAEIFRNNQRGRAESSRALRALTKDVNDFVFVTDNGEDWEGDIQSMRQALIDDGSERAEELLALVDESIEMGGDLRKFNSLPVPDMETNILQDREGPQTKRSLRLIDRKIRAFKNTQSAINKGLGFDLAIKRGIIKAPEPLNTSDPQIREAQLNERIDMTNTVRAWLGVEVSPFTAQEKAGFIRLIQGNDLNAQEGLLNFLGQLPPGMRRRTANDLSKDAPEFAVGIDIAQANGPGARQIMDGLIISRQESIKKAIPLDKDFNAIFMEEVGTAFTRSAEHQNAIFQSAKAVYVAKAFGKGLLSRDVVETQLFKDSITEVTGGMIDRDTGFLGFFGGPAQKIVPPIFGMTSDEFEAALQDPALWETLPQNVSPDNARRNGTFIHKGESQYLVIMPDGRPIKSKNGVDFIIDMSDIQQQSPEELNAIKLATAVEQINKLELRGL